MASPHSEKLDETLVQGESDSRSDSDPLLSCHEGYVPGMDIITGNSGNITTDDPSNLMGEGCGRQGDVSPSGSEGNDPEQVESESDHRDLPSGESQGFALSSSSSKDEFVSQEECTGVDPPENPEGGWGTSLSHASTTVQEDEISEAQDGMSSDTLTDYLTAEENLTAEETLSESNEEGNPKPQPVREILKNQKKDRSSHL